MMPPANICDIAYPDLVSSPTETVRRVYEHFGTVVSPEFSDRLADWQYSKTSSHHRGAILHFDQFGLDQTEIDRLFERYRNRFLSPTTRTRSLKTKPT